MITIIVIVITLTIYFGYYVPVALLSSYISNFIAFFLNHVKQHNIINFPRKWKK